MLTPELTEGPYYVAGEKIRRDITEGKAGVALLLNLTVMNASTCALVKNAAVEIWHCDALGVYSGAVANNPGTNFLRGMQRTNAKGVATFKTIYPGFYQGRAVIGTIAGMMTKTNTIGFVGSFKIPEVVMGVNGFTLAAQAVNP